MIEASRFTTFPHLARWAAAIKLQGIEGLKSANELNGTFGTCLNFVTSSGRWAIATEVEIRSFGKKVSVEVGFCEGGEENLNEIKRIVVPLTSYNIAISI